MPPLGMPPMQQDPGLPPAPGGGMGGGSIEEMLAGGPGGYQDQGTQQAVWSTFPGTDPQVLEQMAGGAAGQGPAGMLGILPQITDLFAQDQQKLDQMHNQQLQALISHLMQPDASQAEPVPPPAVGGESSGF